MVSPQITGHTGNDQTADNSLDSVYRSIELKADAFELDVRMDNKKNLVLSHNELEQDGYDLCPKLASVFEIMKALSMEKQDVLMALGWLARENKIYFYGDARDFKIAIIY